MCKQDAVGEIKCNVLQLKYLYQQSSEQSLYGMHALSLCCCQESANPLYMYKELILSLGYFKKKNQRGLLLYITMEMSLTW